MFQGGVYLFDMYNIVSSAGQKALVLYNIIIDMVASGFHSWSLIRDVIGCSVRLLWKFLSNCIPEFNEILSGQWSYSSKQEYG